MSQDEKRRRNNQQDELVSQLVGGDMMDHMQFGH
jgi:hypothetical protein